MKTHNSLHFVILVPHPGMAASLRGQSRFLFAAGLGGAWSFPQAAPLALLKRPLGEAELRDLAEALREATLPRDGKIALGKPILVPCPGFHSFFGPALDLEPPPLPYPAVIHAFPVLALSVALSAPAEAPLLGRILNLPPANPGFFRAAMVVNLTIRPLFPAGSVPTGPSNSDLPASSVPTGTSDHALPASSVPAEPSDHDLPASSVPIEPSGHEPPAGSVPTGPSDRALPASSVPAEPSDHDPPANSVSVAVAENYSFEWHMGKPRWLPSLRNSRRRGGV